MKLDFASIKKYLSLFTLLFAVVLIGAADKGLEDIINPFNLQDERRFDQSVPLDRFSKPQCGDGAVQKGEVCDPLGSTKRENCKIGGNKSGIRIKTCSNDCSKWNKGQCKPKVICGNGIIEGNENCDDGNLNGQYGQCAGSKSSKKLKIGKPQGNVPPVDSTGTVKLNITSIKDTQVKKCSAPHPAYCGNGRLDYNKKGRPLEACDTVKVKDEDRCLFADGKIGSKPCSSYATSTYNSCASDCQSGGGFCGDGEVQSPEECDDGNNSNEDSCSNQCKKIEPPEPKKGPKKCGNGKVEQGEKCDQGKQKGKQNGIKCTPKYGKSCTYCSADCQNILTVDPKRFCGNAEIDKRGTDEKGNTLYEACELRDGKVISSTSKNLQVGEKYCWNFAAGYGKTCSSESDCSKTKIKNTKTETIKWEKRSKKTEAITFGRNNLETFKAKEKDAEKVIDLTQEITASVIKVSVSPQQVLITFNHQNKNKKITPSSVTLDPGETKNIKIQTMQVIDIGSCKKYTPFVSCLDKGEYQCTNQCNTLKDTCTECVKYKGNNSVPKLSVLNPLIAGNENKNIQWGMKSKNIKPQASFKWVLKKNRKVSFTDLSTDPDGNIKKIEWDFDNKKNKGNDATGKKVSHTYSSDGSYTVKLTVTDNQGNSNSISKSLKVKSGKQRRGKKTQKGLVIKATEGNKEIKASVPSAVKAIGIANSSTKASVYLGMKNKKLAKRDSGLSSGSITKLSGTPVEIAVAGKDKNVDIYVALKDKNKIIRMDKNLKTLKSKDLSAPPTSLAVATGRNNKKRRVFVGLKNKKIKKFDENFGEVGTNNEITLSNTPTTLAIGEKGVKQQQFPINYSKIYVGARGGKLYKIPGLDFKDNPSEYEDMSLSATPETIGAIGEYANHFVYVGLENKKIVRINNGKFKKTATNKLSANPINLGVAGTKKNPDIYAALSNKDIIKLGKNKLNRKKLLTSTSYVAETMDVVGGKNNSDAEVFAGMGKKRASPKGGGGAGGGGAGGGGGANKVTEEENATISLYRPNPPFKNYSGSGEPGPFLGLRYFSQKGAGKSAKWVNPADYKNIITKNKNDGVTPHNNRSIESSKLCGTLNNNNQESEYKLLFNHNLINNINDKNKYVNDTDDNPGNYGKYGDLFEYDVKGEQGAIKNTVIASPPVPPNEIRVVVRWTKKEGKKFGKNSMGEFGSNFFVTSSKRIGYLSGKKGKDKLRNEMYIKGQRKYWHSSFSTTFSDISLKKGVKLKYHINNIGSSDSRAIQATTFGFLKTKDPDPRTIPVYVSSVGKPIQPFQDGNIEVLVYTFHENQDTVHSMYKPTLRFKINEAFRSKNPLAPFWHVFNVKPLNTNNQNKKIEGYEIRVVDGKPSQKGKTLFKILFDKKKNKIRKVNGHFSKHSDRPELDSYSHGQITTRFCNIKEYAIGQKILGCP